MTNIVFSSEAIRRKSTNSQYTSTWIWLHLPSIRRANNLPHFNGNSSNRPSMLAATWSQKPKNNSRIFFVLLFKGCQRTNTSRTIYLFVHNYLAFRCTRKRWRQIRMWAVASAVMRNSNSTIFWFNRHRNSRTRWCIRAPTIMLSLKKGS